MPRYLQWHRVRGDTTDPTLRNIGRKLLGDLESRRKLGGVKTLSQQVELADGRIVRARFVGDTPIVEMHIPEGGGGKRLAQLGGFVTWPTDDEGATALPESVRIVLTGSTYEGIREPEYSTLFPDGLNQAGNVDWHGRDGWVLSWYGPRTRYLESAPELKPYVYSKGLPICDARDFIDVDAVVLGACVVTTFGGVYLLVVSEEFFFGRYEDVWVVRLLDADSGQPATRKSVRYSVDSESFELLDSRFNDDTVVMRHPWFFNPDGTEGRMIAEDPAEAGVAERIIRLVESNDFECGFEVQRDLLLHEQPAVNTNEGYTSATLGYLVGKMVCARWAMIPSLSDIVPTGYCPWGTPVTMFSGTFNVETTEGNYVASPVGLLDFTYARDIASTGEPWQPIAVDYQPDGTVVRAYGRHTDLHVASSGGFQPAGGASGAIGTCTNSYPDSSWYTESYSSASGPSAPPEESVWIHLFAYRWTSWARSGYSVDVEVTYNASEDSILAGIRLGEAGEDAPEVLAERVTNTADGGSYGWVAGAEGQTTDVWVIDESETDWWPDGDMPRGRYGVSGLDTAYVNRHRIANASEQTLYLMHMDLRYGALFTVLRTDVDNVDETTAYTWTDFEEPRTPPLYPASGTHERTTIEHRTTTWRVQGWIHGSVKVDETITTREVNTVTPTSGVPPAYNSTAYDATLVSNLPWNEGVPSGDSYGSLWGSTPAWQFFLPIIYVDPDPSVPDFQTPYEYEGVTSTYPIDPDETYQFTNDEYPILQQLVMSWHLEVEASYPEVEGYSFGLDTDPNRVKVKWHYDAESVGHCGSWAYYKGEWAFSMSMPAPAESDFTMLSECRLGPIEPRILNAEEQAVVEHVYPIWVLPHTVARREIPQP